MTTTSLIKQDDNLEIFSLIWLDNSVNQSPENLDCQRKLRTTINYLKTFDDSHDCQEYIEKLSQYDRVILIVNGRLGQQILPLIHNRRQIISIYVYCYDKQANEQWTKNFVKVKSVITHLEDLVQQIHNDQKKREHDKIEYPLSINFYNSNIPNAQSISGPNHRFIQSQLIINYLLEIQLNEIDKTNFISLCKDYYKNNDLELRIIQEFEHTYTSTRALSWFTRNCFLNRLLTKTFQTENISLLLNLLFFIHDIQQQIEINKSSSHIYHPHLISKEELGVLYKSLGQLITINTFLLAMSDRQQAISILDDYKPSENLLKVLFEIHTNGESCDITSLSYSSDTKQILLKIGTIFHLEKFSSDSNGIIIISISISHQQSIFDNLKNEYMNNKRTVLGFGHMLGKLKRFDDAQLCYLYLTENLLENDMTLSKCYHALGNLAWDREDYPTSIEWHRKSLDIKEGLLTEFHPSFAFSYNSMAAIYYQKGDYEHALDFYKQSLDIWKKEYTENHSNIAMCYNNMGLVYERMGKFSEAIDCYQKVLNIRQKILSNDHVDLGNIYQNFGIVHQTLGQYDLALKYFNQALTIFKKSQHSKLSMILNSIANVYENQSQFQDALSYYQQALTIYRQSLPHSHHDVIKTEKIIERVTAKLDDLNDL